jgi:large subunit ribosomal protein L22
MEVRAVAKYLRVQPRKVRILADEIRGKNALYAAGLLRYHPSKGAKLLRKVLLSAVANAEENHGLSAPALRIATIMVDEGPRLKRIQARAMGRANRILKKTSHITVVVEEDPTPKQAPAKGTKPKPRPTFGGSQRKRSAKVEVAPATQESAEQPAEVQEKVENESVEPQGEAEKGDA